MTEPNQQLVEAVARLAERLWRVHPKEVMDTGLTRQQFYEREIGDLVVAAIQATDGKCQKLRSALEYARNVIVAIAPTSPLRTEAIETIDTALKEQSA